MQGLKIAFYSYTCATYPACIALAAIYNDILAILTFLRMWTENNGQLDAHYYYIYSYYQ